MIARLNTPRLERLQSLPTGFPTGPRRWFRHGHALTRACARRIAEAADVVAPRRRPGEPTAVLPAAVGANDADLARLRWPHPTRALDEARWSGAIPPVGWRW